MEELPQRLEFCQKCSPGFEIRLGLCVYIVRGRRRERWSFWHVLRKAIPSHVNKTQPKRTGETMGWWHFILKTLLGLKVTKLFKCLWIRLWEYIGECTCILPTMKIKSRNFIGHAMVLRYQKKKTIIRKEHQPSRFHYRILTGLIIMHLTSSEVKVNITVTLTDTSFSFISRSLSCPWLSATFKMFQRALCCYFWTNCSCINLHSPRTQ